MAISINVRMNRGDWADFADWLDARYSPWKWKFDRHHDHVRPTLRDRDWEKSDAKRAFYVGPTASIIGKTIILNVDGTEAEEYTLIKMFHETAIIVLT